MIALWERCGLTRPWNDPQTDIRAALDNPSSEILIGERDGHIIASAMVGVDGHRGYAYYVAVEPELQGGGLGRAMMDAAEAWVKDRGAPKFHLLVRSTNDKAMAFYERLGFARDDAVLFGKRLDGR